MPNTVLKFTSAAAAVVVLAAASAAPAQTAKPFSFPRAESLPPRAAMRWAQSFVADALPAGLPMPEAIARVQNSVMSCGAPRGPNGAVDCRYFIESRPVGGDAGEDWWRVRLTPGADGRLQSASVIRYRVGMPSLLAH